LATHGLVSVIMPTHNSSAWIELSAKSVLAQTYSDIELIIVDDLSNDETLEILKKLRRLDTRITIKERSICSGGPATPRNDGLKSAKGNFIAFIDSDDLWHPKKLELQIKTMRDHGINFISSTHIPFEGNPPVPLDIDEELLNVQNKDHATLIRKNWVVTSSAVVNRSLLADNSFNQKVEYIGVEDYLLWLKLHQSPPIKSGILESPLVFYRLRRDSISASKLMMAKKIFYLLSQYSFLGKPLGLKKYLYFTTYVLASLKVRLL